MAVEATAPAIASVLARTVVLLEHICAAENSDGGGSSPHLSRGVYQNREGELIESVKFVVLHHDAPVSFGSTDLAPNTDGVMRIALVRAPR
ncbi:hypothetical protein [Nocardia jiangxiensis]|uniref:hypothetical protein n=1 Tax=Nocardia jiangxiensis TaxID=282685 RepID=UPI00146BC295|nr:hypothetical protein [Nocardia jiangxiensis]